MTARRRTRPGDARPARVAAWTALALLAGTPARAEVALQATGTLDLGYSATGTSVSINPRLYTEARPALVLQFGTPQLWWQAGYLFSGSLPLSGGGTSTYANQLDLSVASQLDPRTHLLFSATASQGGALFQLNRRAPEAAEPAFRAPDLPNLLTATLLQSFSWEATPDYRVGQSLGASASAPQEAPGRASAHFFGSVGLFRLFPTDSLGLVVRPGLSVLRPATVSDPPTSRLFTGSVVLSWNHDFDRAWNVQLSAGVEELHALFPGAGWNTQPTGGLTGRYLAGRFEGSASVSHGASPNLQMGTMSLADAVVARGVYRISEAPQRELGASLGFMHARTLGGAGLPSGSGDAFSGDVGLVWSLSNTVLLNARYSGGYQLGLAAGNLQSLSHTLVVGVAARWGAGGRISAAPSTGGRVDGADGVPFPGSSAPAR